jgi:hypothetical protein
MSGVPDDFAIVARSGVPAEADVIAKAQNAAAKIRKIMRLARHDLGSDRINIMSGFFF